MREIEARAKEISSRNAASSPALRQAREDVQRLEKERMQREFKEKEEPLSVLCLLFLSYSSSLFAESFTLPIWKDEAEARGYTLPEAFGLNVSYMKQTQDISVDSVGFEGSATGPRLAS